MATRLDKKFANGVIEGVNALILEVERLESLCLLYETALNKITKKVPEKVSREEAADMAVEFKQVAQEALNN